jgi:L-ascorbate metabolism protein UlaG (beta-lactamase superfamily)
MQLTWLDSNSWLLEMAGKRLLIDPWLVGSLTFGNLTWLFEGKKTANHPIPENIDLILLSQGLEDHAHPPTLQLLDRQIPVVASPNAAKVAQTFDYQNLTTLTHGASYIFDNAIEITAIPGSPVGPTLVENGYIIKELATNQTIYYEPHGYHSPTLDNYGKIDVIITPLIDLKIPFLGPVIKGQESALAVCKRLQPQYIISTAAGGDIEFKGLLMAVLSGEGSPASFQELLKSNSLPTKVIDPQPWQPFTVELGEFVPGLT